jgi:Uma2 family endonuclease
MGTQPYIEGERYFCTLEEYFLFEETSEQRHEWRHGEVFAMSGGSINHARIGRNLHNAIGDRTYPKGCEPFGPDTRLFTGQYLLYPDLFVSCKDKEFLENRKDTLTNAVLVVEVLSPSTEAFDRGEKFARYKQMPKFKEYVLVSQEKKQVEVWYKQAENLWRWDTYTEDTDMVKLYSMDIEVPLTEFYERVEWE